MTSFLRTKFSLAVLLTALIAVFCSENELIPPGPSSMFSIDIIAGPAEGATVLNNANFTFSWRVTGGSAATFTYKLDGVDATAIATTDFSKSYPGQPAGSYTFTITAAAGGESDSDTRTFTVGGNLFNPSVIISGPRGSQSSGGSGIVPDYAPGANVRLTWVGTDQDVFGNVASYRFKTTDSGTFSDPFFATAMAFDAPTTTGTYTFSVEVTDNLGGTSTTGFQYVAQAADILLVDDQTFADGSDENDSQLYFADVFDGFSFDVIDVSESAFSTPSSDIKIIVWLGSNSGEWAAVGSGASTVLRTFLDGGGKLWAVGQNILEGLDEANPPAGANDFGSKYLHMSTATAWSRAGLSAQSFAFSFANNELGDPVNFPKMKMGVANGNVDKIAPGTGAEAVYSGEDGLENPLGTVALRFPSGNTGTTVFFMSFPLFETRDNKVLLVASQTLASTILTAMRQ